MVALEEKHSQLNMKNVIGRNGSSVLLPKDENTCLTLDALTSNSAPVLKLIRLDPKHSSSRVSSWAIPLRMKEAMRCDTSRLKEETRQVIVTIRGTLPPNLDLDNWGIFYLRPLSHRRPVKVESRRTELVRYIHGKIGSYHAHNVLHRHAPGSGQKSYC